MGFFHYNLNFFQLQLFNNKWSQENDNDCANYVENDDDDVVNSCKYNCQFNLKSLFLYTIVVVYL